VQQKHPRKVFTLCSKMAEKKMRVDKRKNVEKIAKEVLKNPLQTQREIAKKT
jgi:hypothetical protein